MMDIFSYRSGTLCAENMPLETIAAEIGTPFYVYSTAQLKRNCQAFMDAFKGMKIMVCYAVKANANQAVIRTLADCGAGADITSVGELERALQAGIPPQKIIYSGVGKRRDEIEAALLAGIHQINVESIEELPLIQDVAKTHNKRVAVTLRVNPDVAARTHKKISTGELGNKFGIDLVQLDDAMKIVAAQDRLDFKGFQVHIGSHVYDYQPFREAFEKLAELVRTWRGKGFAISRLDLGGGVGIPYDGQTLAPFSDYAAIVRETLGDLGCELAFEPGRRLVGDAGALVSRVVRQKKGVSKNFLIIDAGMNDLVRPAMYDARHSILPVRESHDTTGPLADVVGPVCETSDLFGEDYRLGGVGAGDLIAIMQGGAYGAVMASAYNGRSIVPEVMVSESQYAVIRRRISVAEQIGWESLPQWMGLAKTG